MNSSDSDASDGEIPPAEIIEDSDASDGEILEDADSDASEEEILPVEILVERVRDPMVHPPELEDSDSDASNGEMLEDSDYDASDEEIDYDASDEEIDYDASDDSDYASDGEIREDSDSDSDSDASGGEIPPAKILDDSDASYGEILPAEILDDSDGEIPRAEILDYSDSVAEPLPHRVFVHPPLPLNCPQRHGPWHLQEVECLFRGLMAFGEHRWGDIARLFVTTRSPEQIEMRFRLRGFERDIFNFPLSMAPTAAASSDNIHPRDVCIVGVARTPMGGFLGTLSSVPATKLGSIAIEAALKRANVDPSLVQEVFFGNVLSANLGQAPARQAALGAGLSKSVVCTTVNKVCASGMKATMLAAQSIQLGINDVVVAGGMENMSSVPKYLAEAREGSRLGHDSLVDGMLKDGLWDVYKDVGMGVCAEMCAVNHSISREDQDNYAVQSFERGISAQENGYFEWEITPVEVSGGRGRPSTIVDKDEFDAAKLRILRPCCKETGGSVTADNASSISDGAAALVLVSGEKALKLGLQVIAKISGYADAAQEPELFTTAPALAIPKAIGNAGLENSQIDFYEINEAFVVVALANQKLLALNSEKVNVHGGAVSFGHPLGCSGARILVTLLGVLKQKNGKYGVGGVCNGGGGASALVLELL